VTTVVARLLCALVGAVIAYAGAAKFTDLARWRSDAAAQGVIGPVATALPVVELVLGGWLVVSEPAPVPMALATVLLLVFTVFLAVQVARGSSAPCACFGARNARPPAWRDVLRNLSLIGALAAAAALS
jgi:hypothetical protein